MIVRFQRFVIILISLILLIFAVILILINSKNNLIFFYTPTELINSNIKINNKIRIGGFVKNKTLQKNVDNIYSFIITDNKNEILVEFGGILPDLFKEKQGAVIEGILIKKNKINASTVFAKHDENYMPSSIKDQLKQKNYWKKKY